jgi:hypothetical protein
MICKNCGTDNARNAKNCINCNFPLPADPVVAMPATAAPKLEMQEQQQPTPLPKSPPVMKRSLKPQVSKKLCPQCGYELIADAKVCPTCSFNFAGKQLPEEKPHPEIPVKSALPGPPAEVKRPAVAPEQPAAPPAPLTDAPGQSGMFSSKPTTLPFGPKKDGRSNMEGTIDPFRKDQPVTGIAFLKPVPKQGEEDTEAITIEGGTLPIPVNRALLDAGNNTITSKTQAVFTLKDGEWFITDKSDQQTTFIRPGTPIKLTKGDIILMGNRKFIFDY